MRAAAADDDDVSAAYCGRCGFLLAAAARTWHAVGRHAVLVALSPVQASVVKTCKRVQFTATLGHDRQSIW